MQVSSQQQAVPHAYMYATVHNLQSSTDNSFVKKLYIPFIFYIGIHSTEKSSPSTECSIVIIDQYYENNRYHHYNGKCVKGSGDFLSALCWLSCD